MTDTAPPKPEIDFASLPEVDRSGRSTGGTRKPRFDGDVSALPDRACWALQHLLTRRYISGESDSDIYAWVLEYRSDLAVRLSELDLQLRIADLQRDQGMMQEVAVTAPRLLQDYPRQVEPLLDRWLGEKRRYGDV